MFFHIVSTPISTTSGLWSTGNTRKYHQIDVYIYQCAIVYTNIFCFLCNHGGGVSANTVCLKRQKGKEYSSLSINVLIDFGKMKENIAPWAPSKCDIDY